MPTSICVTSWVPYPKWISLPQIINIRGVFSAQTYASIFLIYCNTFKETPTFTKFIKRSSNYYQRFLLQFVLTVVPYHKLISLPLRLAFLRVFSTQTSSASLFLNVIPSRKRQFPPNLSKVLEISIKGAFINLFYQLSTLSQMNFPSTAFNSSKSLQYPEFCRSSRKCGTFKKKRFLPNLSNVLAIISKIPTQFFSNCWVSYPKWISLPQRSALLRVLSTQTSSGQLEMSTWSSALQSPCSTARAQ